MAYSKVGNFECGRPSCSLGDDDSDEASESEEVRARLVEHVDTERQRLH